MSLSALSPQQRAAASAKAVEIRRARGQMLDGLRSGQVHLADVLDRTDDVARRTKVFQALKALPGYGPAKATKLMADAGIGGNRRLGGLGAQQRRRLIDMTGSS